MFVAMLFWAMTSRAPVDAVLCYKCSGRTGDGSCGTPFNENGIETCEAKACLTSRILKQQKQGETSVAVKAMF